MSSEESADIVLDAKPASKRKRSTKEAQELEIDVNLPEPPSKKAKRKEKKTGSTKKRYDTTNGEGEATATVTAIKPSNSERKAARLALKDHSDLLDEAGPETASPAQSKHGEYGVWIGNLPFNATRDTIRGFLNKHAGIEESDITRLHLPGPTKQTGRKQAEQHNRGFAYVDFTTKDITEKAIAVSEKLVDGRRLLIKDAKNFEGRPPKKAQDGEEGVNGVGEEVKATKQSSKRVFVGNLDFEVTRDDIYELFAPAGDVEDVFLATFEDTGKCKGFGWVRFASVAGAEAAVKGFLYRETPADETPAAADDSDAEIVTEKKSKSRRQKVWLNRIHGRNVRCEFAEDPQTRYKKRFGKDKSRDRDQDDAPNPSQIFDIADVNSRKVRQVDVRDGASRPRQDGKLGKEERREERRKRHDARTVAPGQALANTQRASGAIVAAKGTKITFN